MQCIFQNVIKYFYYCIKGKQNGELDADSPTRAISSSRDEVFPNEKSTDKPKDLLEDKLQGPVKR